MELHTALMVYMNKTHRFITNTSKMTFTEKNKTFCVKMILVLKGTWKLNFTMKIFIIIMISHSYISSINED